MASPGDIPIRPEDRQTVICLYCAKSQDISRRAISVVCKHCGKHLKLEDIVIREYVAKRAIETCGVVVVERKGQVVADRVLCSNVVVRGKMKSDIVCRESAFVGNEAEIRGDVSAQSLAVGAGAVLEGYYRIGPTTAPQTPSNPRSSADTMSGSR